MSRGRPELNNFAKTVGSIIKAPWNFISDIANKLHKDSERGEEIRKDQDRVIREQGVSNPTGSYNSEYQRQQNYDRALYLNKKQKEREMIAKRNVKNDYEGYNPDVADSIQTDLDKQRQNSGTTSYLNSEGNYRNTREMSEMLTSIQNQRTTARNKPSELETTEQRRARILQEQDKDFQESINRQREHHAGLLNQSKKELQGNLRGSSHFVNVRWDAQSLPDQNDVSSNRFREDNGALPDKSKPEKTKINHPKPGDNNILQSILDNFSSKDKNFFNLFDLITASNTKSPPPDLNSRSKGKGKGKDI